jgi:hypothetical protein
LKFSDFSRHLKVGFWSGEDQRFCPENANHVEVDFCPGTVCVFEPGINAESGDVHLGVVVI